MTCLGFGFDISSKTWCPTWAGSSSGAPQWSHLHFFSGALVISGLGLHLVMPMCPFGHPGKRFTHLVWSPVRVGYIRLEEGVCGFS